VTFMMKIIYFLCLVLWGLLCFKIGEQHNQRKSQEEFELIANDAIKRIQLEKSQFKLLQEITKQNETMCVDQIEKLEKNVTDLFMESVIKEKILEYILKEYICLKKVEI